MRLTTVLSILFFLNTNPCLAQSMSPGTVNVSGESASFDKYRFEWSLGESVAITTMSNSNSNLLVTNGFLQFNVQNQPAANQVKSFLPDEIRVYPNPVKDILEINIRLVNEGPLKIELLDAHGNEVMPGLLNYTGMGAIQKWNVSLFPAGQYFLYILQKDAVTGKLMKSGAFKILKVN